MLDATRALEEFVRECPEQWLWMHRRWKPLPGDQKAALTSNLAGESA
jgi:lauroyl/myristoyl acyltransferase